MMTRLSLLLAALGVVALLQGCDNKGSGSAGGGSQKKLQLAFVANTADEYWSIVRLGCDFAARQLGDVDLDFRFPAERTAAAQQELLTNLLAAGVDGIAISPIDAENQTDFLNNIAAKTLLVARTATRKKAGGCVISARTMWPPERRRRNCSKPRCPRAAKSFYSSAIQCAKHKRPHSRHPNGLAGSNIQIIDTLAEATKAPSP